MKHAAGTLAFIARFVVLGLALAFVVGLLWPASGARLRARLGLGNPMAPVTTSAPAAGPVSYADAVATASA